MDRSVDRERKRFVRSVAPPAPSGPPRIVLVSCGERNRFGHPDHDVLDRYRRAGASVFRTDQEGAVRVTIGRTGGWVSTRKHPAPVFVPWARPDWVTPSSHIP